MYIHININTALAVPVNTSAVHWTNIKGMYTLVGSFESPGTRICIWLCNVYIHAIYHINGKQTDMLSPLLTYWRYHNLALSHIPMTPPWWRHQMETFSALLAICAGNSPVPGEFPAQRPMTRSFDVLFDLRLNQRLSKQLWGWWFETPSRPLWRHCNETRYIAAIVSKVVDHW